MDTAAPAAPFKTLVKAVPGQSLTVKANRGGVMVDNAKVVKTDIIATNLTSAFDCAHAALADLTSQEDGRMVFVASVAGLKGAAYAAPYAASKHGMVGLMRSLAAEFAKTSLTVNAVCPSFVDTPMVDDSAERIARVSKRSVCTCASSGSSRRST